MATARERKPWNALKLGTSREVYSKEGVALAEGLELVPPNCSEVGTPLVELDGAVGEALVTKPFLQRIFGVSKFFNIRIDDPFLD